MNYKKGLFSLVAATLLSSTAMADTSAVYLPLSNKDHDASWILFGVNGFSSGVPSTRSNGTTSFSSGMTELEDADADDNHATEGLYAGGDTTKPLASLQGLKESSLTSVKVGVDIDGIVYEPTEAVRTMYIKVNDTSPNVKFNYKSSLEGLKMEIMINGADDKKYYVTISQDNTYSNAAVASEFTPTVDSSAGLSSISAIFDANATDNPEDAKYWDKTKHLTTIDNAASVTFYKFDSKTQQWKIYKNRNSGISNDFTSLEVGSAYWGRVDTKDNPVSNDNDGASALILGKSGFTTQSQLPQAYVDDNNNSKLAEGWNMLAFDDIKPDIRYAATGLILSGIAADDNITVKDASGVYSVDFVFSSGAGDYSDAERFNKIIESKRLRGIIPEYFYIKAFQGSAAGTMILVSNEKFTVVGNNDGAIDVTTLTGADPYDVNASRVDINSDLDANGPAVSVYGEYALMLKPLVGATSIDGNATNGGFSKIIIGDPVNSDHSALAITTSGNSDLATAETQIESDSLSPTATQVDTNFDGTADMLIVAASKPFYVRDATYTRVFDYTASSDTGTITVDGSAKAEVSIAANATAQTVADDINNTFSTTNVRAVDDGSKIIAATTELSTFDIRDAESATIDYLRNSDPTSDFARGAIKGVYSLSTLAKKPVVPYYWEFSGFTTSPDNNADGVDVNVTGTAVAVQIDGITQITLDNGDSNTTGRKKFLDDVVAELNKEIVSLDKHGYAAHNYTEEADNFSSAKITVVGIDMNDTQQYIVDRNESGSGDVTGMFPAATAVVSNPNNDTNGTLGTLSGDLVANLKFNAVYTPNYANYGPLYTMRDSGYDVKAMIKATTNMVDGSIAWDSIDLTRDEDDWFIQNEFNLFNVNMYSGYWVYLTPKAEKTITISNATYTPTYSYYFDLDTDKTTTNNIIGGQLKVTVTGLSDTTSNEYGNTSNVYAIVGGEEIQMKRNSSTVYSVDITKYSSIDFKEMSSNIAFTIRATDGKGSYAKLDDAISFDYAKPAKPSVTFPNAATATFTSTSTDVAKMYVFKDYIPEISTDRTNAIIETIEAAGGTGTSAICSKFDFGVVNTLKVVAVDGTGNFGTANVSNAYEFKYASLFKGASVITDATGGDDIKSTLPTIYTTDCTLAATQPSGSENNGVSIKSLESGYSARIAYIGKDVAFDENAPWDSKYEITDGAGAIVQLQNVEEYAGQTFLLEYDGSLYRGTFPATSAAADASIDDPIDLTEIYPVNTSLAGN